MVTGGALGLGRNGVGCREMQTVTMKLWTAAAGAAAGTTMAAPPDLANPEDGPTTASPTDFVYPTGFDKALSLMLAGEGGENGIGSHRVWPTLSFPALTTEQIQKALTGNTLAIPYHYAHPYGADGTVGGYNIRYDPNDLKNCPKTEIHGDGLLRTEAVCSAQVNEPITARWKAEDKQF